MLNAKAFSITTRAAISLRFYVVMQSVCQWLTQQALRRKPRMVKSS